MPSNQGEIDRIQAAALILAGLMMLTGMEIAVADSTVTPRVLQSNTSHCGAKRLVSEAME